MAGGTTTVTQGAQQGGQEAQQGANQAQGAQGTQQQTTGQQQGTQAGQEAQQGANQAQGAQGTQQQATGQQQGQETTQEGKVPTRAELAASLQALQQRVEQGDRRERVSWARRRGLSEDVLSDQDLGDLLPAVDPTTDEGVAQLTAWADARSGLFPSSTVPEIPKPEQILDGLKPNRLWNQTRLDAITRNSMGTD